MTSLDEIRLVKESQEADLLSRPGVTGVGIGYKEVNGVKTDELAIIVYVEAKKPNADVPTKERVPKTIQKMTTDVQERTFVPHQRSVQVAELEKQVDAGKYSPLKGGISIGTCRQVGNCTFVGTLGAIVEDNQTGDPMVLSNFHVLCVDNNWSVGDRIVQPGRPDGGNCPTDVVAQLSRATLGGKVDGAVARIIDQSHFCGIEEIGRVKGKNTASLGMKVRKRGRTTELTYGTVDAISLTVSVPYDDADCNVSGVGTITFTDQIGIAVDTSQNPQFGIGGDSGSVVVDDDEQVIGLYFAGTPDGTYGVANPIDAVLEALDVSLCIPPVAKNVFKDTKDVKDGKFEKFEIKDHKFEKIEIKEHKFEKFEKLENKEFIPDHKVFDIPDPKLIVENRPGFPPPFTQPPIVQPPMASSTPDIETRLARIEALLTQLMQPPATQGPTAPGSFKPPFEKIPKIEKPEKLEKPEKFEGKDKIEKLEKPEKFEKHEKFEKPEIKDGKEPKEFKEPKEVKEHIKDFKEPKEIFENIAPPVGPVQPVQPTPPQPFPGQPFPGTPPAPPVAGAPSSVEQRLAGIEAALAQLGHFIRPEHRPDLSTGALRGEDDYT